MLRGISSLQLCRFRVPSMPAYLSNGQVQSTDRRSIHWTDYPKPCFDDDLRRDSTKCPEVKASDNNEQRRLTSYLPSFVVGVAGLYSTKAVVLQHILFMAPSRDVLASARTEVNLSGVPEGKVLTVKWRGKPVFIYHRSQKQIATERAFNVADLRDPEEDSARAQRPEWVVMIGICTHLGCVPLPYQGIIPGGFYCSCHGSHFDTAGRIRRGPAPTNMEIPPYEFTDDENIVIG